MHQILSMKNEIDIYDKIIEKCIQKTKMNSPKKFSIGSFKTKRKIPDKEELSDIYNKFIKNINNKKTTTDNSHFKKSIVQDVFSLIYPNNYLYYRFVLHPSKNYKIKFKCNVSDFSDVTFLFHNKKTTQFLFSNRKIVNEIIFCSNILTREWLRKWGYVIELYVIWNSEKKSEIQNLFLQIEEINSPSYSMTIINQITYIT